MIQESDQECFDNLTTTLIRSRKRRYEDSHRKAWQANGFPELSAPASLKLM